jgi:hypothetical protein
MTRIWIEPIKRDDGRSYYSGQKGLSVRTRLDGSDGEVLCDGVFNPVCHALPCPDGPRHHGRI